MWEISSLECKQTETKEHEVEIALVGKTGGGSNSGVQGHHKPWHVSAQQCQQGHKFSTDCESISHREKKAGNEAHLRNWNTAPCVIGFWTSFFIYFFSKLLQAGGSRRVELPWASTKTCGQLRKRDCSGIYLRIKFIKSTLMWSGREKEKKKLGMEYRSLCKLQNPKFFFNRNRNLKDDIWVRSQKP